MTEALRRASNGQTLKNVTQNTMDHEQMWRYSRQRMMKINEWVNIKSDIYAVQCPVINIMSGQKIIACMCGLDVPNSTLPDREVSDVQGTVCIGCDNMSRTAPQQVTAPVYHNRLITNGMGTGAGTESAFTVRHEIAPNYKPCVDLRLCKRPCYRERELSRSRRKRRQTKIVKERKKKRLRKIYKRIFSGCQDSKKYSGNADMCLMPERAYPTANPLTKDKTTENILEQTRDPVTVHDNVVGNNSSCVLNKSYSGTIENNGVIAGVNMMKRKCHVNNNVLVTCDEVVHDKVVSVMHINARYVRKGSNKELTFLQILEKNDIDIFGITEHKQTEMSAVPEYAKYHRWAKCRTKERGGGVALYIKKSIRAWKLQTLDWPDQMEQDTIWTLIDTGDRKIAVGLVYIRARSWEPQAAAKVPIEYGIEFMQLLQSRILELQDKEYDILVMGDFNSKTEIKEGCITAGGDPWGEALIAMCQNCRLDVWNYGDSTTGKITRFPDRGSGEGNTLDYILHNGMKWDYQYMYIDESRQMFDDSDHVIALARVLENGNIQEREEVKREAWNIKDDTPWEIFTQKLDELMGSEPRGPTVSYEDLKNRIKRAGEETVGKRKYKVGKIVESNYLQHLRGRLRYLRRKERWLKAKANNSEPYRLLAEAVYELRNLIRTTRKVEEGNRLEKYMERLLNKYDVKMYNLYRYVKGCKTSTLERFGLTDINGTQITDDNETRVLLRQQWLKIYNPQYWPNAEYRERLVDAPIISREDSDRMDEPITRQEVIEAIKELKAGTSAGTTDIPPDFLKHLPESGLDQMVELCKEWWESESMPPENDTTESRFLHKKGSTATLDNYRTLATGCNICKVYLRVVYNRINLLVENYNLLGEIQNGFRKKRRAMDNLITVDTVIRKAKREHKPIYIALLDITKAYDRVCRQSLWFKMKGMGFGDKMLRVLEGVYRDPKSILIFQDIKTEPLPMDIGLRQGCVLSPILFAIYIADLGNELTAANEGMEINGRILPGMFFADDMVLWGDKSSLQKLLNITAKYATTWKVEFSGAKSLVIPINKAPENEIKKVVDRKGSNTGESRRRRIHRRD